MMYTPLMTHVNCKLEFYSTINYKKYVCIFVFELMYMCNKIIGSSYSSYIHVDIYIISLSTNSSA